jgi:3-oxoacyl-(acyl-carrier-protein) synthase
MQTRVVVTGIGLVTPIGIGRREFWSSAVEGRSGIASITRFDPAPFRCRVAGEARQFRADEYVERKIIKQTDRSTHMAMACCAMAVDDAALDLEKEDSSQVGICFANVFGGMEFAEPELYTCTFCNPAQVSAYQSIAWFYAAAQGQWSISRGIHGYAKSIVADRTGGTQAVGWAMKAIQQGHCTMCFAGGFEAPLVPYVYFIHESAGILACSAVEDAYRPFDRRRTGLIVGEGAGVLLLEERGHALARGARIHSEVAGFSVSRDSLSRCFRTALADARVAAADVGYYSPDAIARVDADYQEASAIADVFNDRAHVALSSSKPLTGHMLAAAGIVDAAMATMVIEENIIPALAHVEDPDPAGLDVVVGRPRERSVPVALCCSRGIGGLNTALVLKRHE